MRYVNFPGHTRLIGQFVDVVITEAMSNSLRGRLKMSDETTDNPVALAS
jgi:tRNA-2-methylthio-N6-dimethylallyladenosine synthase